MVQIIKTARGGITSEHGESVGRTKPHVGIDIGHGDSTDEDLLMVAPADGVVTAAGWSGTYGNRVIITHADGTWSLIAHMDSLAVSVGERVTQGQKVGVMGRTGGPWGSIAGWFVHGHQEYHLANGVAVNPLDYLGSTAASTNRIVIDNPKESITMAEAYIQTPNKKVIHFQPGVKAEFDSVPEYEDWRSRVNFLLQRKVSDLLTPPPLKDVPEIPWPFYTLLCNHFNVPAK